MKLKVMSHIEVHLWAGRLLQTAFCLWRIGLHHRQAAQGDFWGYVVMTWNEAERTEEKLINYAVIYNKQIIVKLKGKLI